MLLKIPDVGGVRLLLLWGLRLKLRGLMGFGAEPSGRVGSEGEEELLDTEIAEVSKPLAVAEVEVCILFRNFGWRRRRRYSSSAI